MIQNVGIIGAGTMGSSMAQIFARYQYNVVLYNHRKETLEKAEINISQAVETLVESNELTEVEGNSLKSRIQYTMDLNDLKDTDLIVENVAEVLEIKKDVYQKVSEVVSKDTIIATNTSGLSINTLSKAVLYPERFLGFHWFNPPHVIPLIEIIRCDETREDVVQTIYDLSLNIHKKPAIVLKDVPGFAANRLQLALYREALAMVEDGVVSKESVDAVVKYGLGFRWACIGPLETMDFGGLDIFEHISEYLMPDLCDSHEVPNALAKAVENNHLGVKTQEGFYSYTTEEVKEKTKERDAKLLAVLHALYKD